MPYPIRIIAWGNRGRCDDGVALILAERLETRFADDPDVSVQQYHQLGPELADDLGQCRLAIFIDAHVNAGWDDVVVQRVEPADVAGLHTHHCPPPVLLALAKSMGVNVPESHLVMIRGRHFEFGDELSAETAAGLERADTLVMKLVTSAKRVKEGVHA